jgi:hypothetical protein
MFLIVLRQFSIGICHNPSLELITKALLARLRVKRETQESHLVLLGVQESVRE